MSGAAPRWARRARARRSSGWYPWRGRRIRVLREHQASVAASEPCWRTSDAGRDYQAQLQELVNGPPNGMLLWAGDTVTYLQGGWGSQTYPLPEPFTVTESGWYQGRIFPDGTATVRRVDAPR